MDIMRRLKKHFIKKGIEVKKIYLFGSYAKHTAHTQSDIDVCVIIPRIHSRFKWVGRCYDESREIDHRIQPLVYAPSQFQAWRPVIAEIMETGIEIK